MKRSNANIVLVVSGIATGMLLVIITGLSVSDIQSFDVFNPARTPTLYTFYAAELKTQNGQVTGCIIPAAIQTNSFNGVLGFFPNSKKETVVKVMVTSNGCGGGTVSVPEDPLKPSVIKAKGKVQFSSRNGEIWKTAFMSNGVATTKLSINYSSVIDVKVTLSNGSQYVGIMKSTSYR